MTGHPVGAMILAGGRSTRMAPENKLLVGMPNGEPMIRATARQVLASRAFPVVVTTGHQAEAIRGALDGLPVRFAHAADYRQGMSASLRAGLAALPAEIAAVLICLGDMPLVAAETLDAIISAFAPERGAKIVVPESAGRRGNPILWHKDYFPELACIEGDMGGRELLRRHGHHILPLALKTDTVCRDFDTVAEMFWR